MSKLAESTLIRLLSDYESLSYLSQEGIDLIIIADDELRDVVQWALTYQRNGGRAPSIAALMERHSDVVSDKEIDLEDEPEETIEWAVEQLTANYVRSKTAKFNQALATEMTNAALEDRVEVLQTKASELMALVLTVQSKRCQTDMREAEEVMKQYDYIVDSGQSVLGATLGLPEVDEHVKGVHNGELCIISGTPKSGKSFMLDYIALKNWQAGGTPALYTLENTIEMTQLRIAAMAVGLSIQELQDGTLSDFDYKRLVTWVNEVEHAEHPLYILAPDLAMRNPQAIVAQAKALGADSLIIDQLTFLEPVTTKPGYNRTQDMRTILHDLKGLISTGRNQLPCIMAHQVSREGVKAAERTGAVAMYHMSDSAEVERSADMLFSLWASDEQRTTNRMTLQMIAARRLKPKDFELHWSIDVGKIAVLREM